MKAKVGFSFVDLLKDHMNKVIIVVLLVSISLLNQCNKEEVGKSNYIAKESIEPATGGSISVVNKRGDSIILTLTSWVLTEETEIILKALDEPPDNPFANNNFPGVSIEPDHLMLKKAANLRVVFASPISDTSTAILFYAKGADLAFPLGNQTVTVNSMEGEILHFSDYSGGNPTADEAGDQGDKLVETLFPDLYNWQDFYEMVRGILSYIDMLTMLGNENKAQEITNNLSNKIKEVTSAFLALPIPDEPCGYYQEALFKYGDLVMLMVDDEQLQQQYSNREVEIRNRCYIKGEIEYDYDLYHSLSEGGATSSMHYTVNGYVPFYVNTYAEPVGDIHGQGTTDYNCTGETTGGGITCAYTGISTVTSTISGVLALDDFGTAWLEINLNDVFPQINTTMNCTGSPIPIPYIIYRMTWEHSIRALPEEGYEVIVPETTGGTYKWIIHLNIQP